MSLFDELKDLGVDVDGGLKRIMGNEALYKRLLGSFVKATREHALPEDFDAADCPGAIEKAHAIKGTSGNLSLTPIYEAYTEIVNELRAGEPEKARTLLKNVLPVQEQILQCIERNME